MAGRKELDFHDIHTHTMAKEKGEEEEEITATKLLFYIHEKKRRRKERMRAKRERIFVSRSLVCSFGWCWGNFSLSVIHYYIYVL